MTNATRKDPRTRFAPRFLPWLLATLMFGVYALTLNRWISLFNMGSVAQLSGWTWGPSLDNPLIFLLTYPLRWLPTGQIPIALNLFSALCAAATLGLLARSVALLPQDRTEAQRLREHSDFSFLTSKGSWLPPIVAVLACGLQFTFWENATNFTGESVDLLVFAFTVWSLMEYRLDEKDGRLMLAVFFYCADMSENFAMIGFLPLLVAALIWIRGLAFFNSGFLLRLMLCGLAGGSLYLLMPTLAVISGKMPGALWWQAFKINVESPGHVLKYFFTNTDFRHNVYLISLTTLFPVLLLSFRWSAAFGDRSKLGTALTGLMIHAVYGVMLFICVWGAFDPPFGARHLSLSMPEHLSFLTFYLLAALGIGYYCGYFLLVSKVLVSKSSRRRIAPWKTALRPIVIVSSVLLTLLVGAGLIIKNGPTIRSINSGLLRKYAELMAAGLPHTGGIILSDNESAMSDMPRRLYLVQEELVQEGRDKEYVPVDTGSLQSPNYHRYLHKRYPTKWPLVVNATNQSVLAPRGLLAMLQLLSQTNDIFYLHPSFGYYFEAFYQEPHGVIYKLRNLPADTLLPPLADNTLQAENRVFWTKAQTEVFTPILKEMAPKDPFAKPHTFSDKLMARLHVTPEPNYNAQIAGMYYSRSLDFWGVQAQRCGELAEAGAAFEMAERLNPDNRVAAINLECNQNLRAGRQPPVDLSKTTPDHFGKFRSWSELVTVNGPFDEPSFCFEDGNIYMQGALIRQALASFKRACELAPDYLPARLALGEAYVFSHRPVLALKTLQGPLENPARFSLNATNSTELNVIAAAAYVQETNLVRGVNLLEREIHYHPDDDNLLASATQLFLKQGLFTNALHVINLKLASTPDDPSWLFSLGITEMWLNHFEEAVTALTRVINQQTNNYDAVFNRAVALLNTGKFDSARTDYLRLKSVYPQSFRVAYGLGDIAWRQHDTNGAIQNYTIFLANAPTNTAEFPMIVKRLAALKGRTP